MTSITQQHDRMYGWSLHLAGVTAVALVLGGFYALFDRPWEQQQLDFVDRTRQLDKLLLLSGSARNEHRQLSDQLRNMERSVEELHNNFSTQPSETTFLNDVNRIAANTKLQILDYQVGLKKSLSTHSQSEIQFRCNGSYASVCQFLEKIEQLTKTTKLSKFELKADTNFDGYPIQMTFVLYSRVPSHDTKEKRGVL